MTTIDGITIDEIAEARLEWAKYLRKKNEELEAEVERLREEISRLNKWEDNVREFFGDEVMIDLYDIYGGEEE